MISDWDDAYANTSHIESAKEYPPRWNRLAQEFRERMTARRLAQLDIAYGPGARQRFDLFSPAGDPCGLVVFVHGGYWRAFDKSSWSHLAAGSIARGWQVAIPSYDLAPAVSIGAITRQTAAAIELAAGIGAGPLRLVGHSAGGHLVTRMVCRDGPLATTPAARIERVVSISGLHDLRPLLKTAMNQDFRMTESEACAESPALLRPLDHVELVCWVGANERPEFIRQSSLLANIWSGFVLSSACVQAAGQHHFDVIDGLADPASPLCQALLN